MSEADSSLVTRCRAGDPAAWDDLFDRHYDPVGRFIFQLHPGLNHADVEDLCQEVFLAAVRNFAAFQGKAAVQTWLFRIAINKTRDFLEKRSAAKRGGGRPTESLDAPDPATGLLPDPASPAPGPDQRVLSGEQDALLAVALGTLGDPCRTVIELRYFGDLSYEELARELGITVKAAGSRLHKCLARLAALVRERQEREASAPKSV